MIFNTPHGQYVLVRRIATSGMAEVFLAKSPDDHLEKFVALKCLHAHLADERRVLRLFYEEARIGSLFRSPNLITVHDARLMADRHTMVMDFAAGTTSDSLRDRGTKVNQPLSIAETLEVCRQAASGLHDAHQTLDDDGELLGIVHRDVSPDNILLGFDGKVRVLDFGVAETSRVTSHPSTGAGKAAYMPPEVLRGEACDHRVDVYSLGVVLYELLAGRSPYRRESPAQTLQAVAAAVCPPPLPERWNSVNRLVMRAMAADANERFENAHHLNLALEGEIVKIGETVQLADRIRTLFTEERGELQQQILKIQRAPAPSPSTVDLKHSPDEAISTVNPRQFEFGEAGIHTSILQLDAEQSAIAGGREPDDSLDTSKTTVFRPQRSSGVAISLLLVALFVLGALFGARTLGLFPFASTAQQLVRVDSEPPGATIRLNDDSDEMMAPSQVAFNPTKSDVLYLSLPGYVSAEMSLSAQTPAELSVPLTIDPTSPDAPIGSVRVTFAPVNARLKVDGVAHEGLSPRSVEQLAVDRDHSLSLELDGFEPLYVPFQLGSTEMLELDLRLTEGGPLGQLTVNSVPSGAAVEINDQSIGTSPVEGVELPADQTYTITVSKPGYRRWRQAVYLDDEAKLLNVELDRSSPSALGAPEPAGPEGQAPEATPTGRARDDYPYELIRD